MLDITIVLIVTLFGDHLCRSRWHLCLRQIFRNSFYLFSSKRLLKRSIILIIQTGVSNVLPTNSRLSFSNIVFVVSILSLIGIGDRGYASESCKVHKARWERKGEREREHGDIGPSDISIFFSHDTPSTSRCAPSKWRSARGSSRNRLSSSFSLLCSPFFFVFSDSFSREFYAFTLVFLCPFFFLLSSLIFPSDTLILLVFPLLK